MMTQDKRTMVMNKGNAAACFCNIASDDQVEVDCKSQINLKPRKTYNRIRKRRWQGTRFIVLTTLFSLCYLCVIVFSNLNFGSRSSVHAKPLFFDTDSRTIHRRLLSNNATTQSPSNTTTVSSSSQNYPPDIFTETQLKQGAVILHFIGVIYMFVALAIVCDEFFVPALEVITDKLQLSADVAGATFMAAGGSAPELFTSFIGTFFSGDNVGIGTIVGSAVFNILFVIGMCAMVSKTVLALTWWPLFRDVSFYSISLLVLIGTFNDGRIQWWEALLLLLCYIAYVVFMKFNQQVEDAVKSKLMKNKVTTVCSTDDLIQAQKMQSKCSVPNLHAGGNKFRQGVLQLMIHTIDPLGEGKVQEKAIQMQAVASLKVLMNAENGVVHEQNHNCKNGAITAISNGQLQTDNIRNHSNHTQESQQTTLSVAGKTDEQEVVSPRTVNGVFVNAGNAPPPPPVQYTETNNVTKTQEEDLENENEPLDISWPDTARKRIVYILIFPIIFPLWLCLPDVRKPEKVKFYPWTFIGSIIAIGIFSYLMNWWANVVGSTAGIPPEVMGLTILAAGTSVPDLITSVIVAKKGFGDMAVSSSVGSNIFDVTVGLPLPWIAWSLSHGLRPISVLSAGLFCSIILLFIMLILVIVCIAAFKWNMNKAMGGCMFALYLVFLAIALLLEFKIIVCPVGA